MSNLPSNNSNNNNHSQSPMHAGNKSKKSKSELLRAAVGLLLKQKKFVGSEKFRKSDFLLLQNKNNFAVQKMLEADMHSGNCFTYSNVQCITNNQHIVDQQFARFTQFVETQPEVLRSELKRFYAPMLCHFYLELLKAREPKGAVDFLRKYAHLVAPVELYDAPLPTKINGCSVPNDTHTMSAGEAATPTSTSTSHTCIRFARDVNDINDPELEYFMKLVQTLSSCTKLETAEQDSTVAHFRASKYEIHTTEAVVNALCRFLERRGHVLILNLIYTWIHIHMLDHELQQFTEDQIFLGDNTEDMHELLRLDNEDYSASSSSCIISVDGGVSSRHEEKPNVLELSKTIVKRAAEEPTIKLEEQIKIESMNNESNKATEEESAATVPNIDVCLKNMRDASEQILKDSYEYPRFITIADNGRGLTSAHLDENECHMIAGFDNSVVQLWQLNQHHCAGKNFYRPHSNANCYWELNNVKNTICEEETDTSHDEDDTVCSVTERKRRRKEVESKFDGNSYNAFGGIQLRGHSLGVTDVRFSSHYPLIYSTSKDCTMRCWRAHNFECAAIYTGHCYPIWCMNESPTGFYIATGSRDMSARLWSLECENPLIVYAGHTQDVECLMFHPNGNYIATGSSDHTVRLWCVTSGKLVRVFTECKQSVQALAFSPDGKMLAAAGEESKVRIFDLAAGTQLTELKEHTASITSLAWSPCDHQLASVCSDGSFRLWDVKKLTSIRDIGNSVTTETVSSSSSSTTNRVLTLNGSCQRLIKVCYTRSRLPYCLGA